jgi:hypothetical protein
MSNKTTQNENTEQEYSDIITIKDFKTKEIMYYNMMNKFFNNCTEEEIKLMIEIINGNNTISLRFLDWFVTRYCYLYKLSFNVNNGYCKEENFNINISYKAQLKSFKKKYFDPFRRKKKFFYTCTKYNLTILTTLGQLNFFRWAMNYDIIKYTEKNYKEITSQISHVNKYFKKNIIETNSLSITSTTSDDNPDIENNIEINKSSKIKISKKEYKYPQVSRNIIIEF